MQALRFRENGWGGGGIGGFARQGYLRSVKLKTVLSLVPIDIENNTSDFRNLRCRVFEHFSWLRDIGLARRTYLLFVRACRVRNVYFKPSSLMDRKALFAIIDVRTYGTIIA